MSLYPSLEDMKVDQMGRAQAQAMESILQQQQMLPGSGSGYPSLNADNVLTAYPDLADYMGLELSQELIAANMPEYLNRAMVPSEGRNAPGLINNMVAPLSGNSVGLLRSQVTHGIRELILCKDAKGKVGLRVQAINKGVFVCVVVKESPAALAGLRFGDQILQVNGTTVAGFSVDDVHKLLKKSSDNNISVIIRDRPFERTLTLHKDSTNHIGFQFKDGKITAIVKDSSAARNGLLIEHHLLEINGQNVVGMKDKEVSKIIAESPQITTITVIPSFLYEHIIKKLSSSLIKGKMDHSVPDF